MSVAPPPNPLPLFASYFLPRSRTYACRVFVGFFSPFFSFLRQIHECLIGLPIVIDEPLCELYPCRFDFRPAGSPVFFFFFVVYAPQFRVRLAGVLFF